jgi:hypothetical protein
MTPVADLINGTVTGLHNVEVCKDTYRFVTKVTVTPPNPSQMTWSRIHTTCHFVDDVLPPRRAWRESFDIYVRNSVCIRFA